ncbi:MAG TPA: TonB-dependent receptor [Bacteroidales bacterium]|nr:TonB-dependent receptor [Bacteroidales bacterium]
MKKFLLIFISLLCYINAYGQQTITGKVTDDKNAPLPGVSVQVKGTTKGAFTDVNGGFSIQATKSDTLIFSMVGMVSRKEAVGAKTYFEVSMTTETTKLGEVVVVGYGTQKKMEVTGSVAQVKGDEISKQPAVNPISSLQGKVAGVQITNPGSPGASPEIRIRGVGTVYGNANPLYVVDGVWYDDISFLNPTDIESINILKDASSESIYGIRAANGVVLITTVKGSRNTKAVVTYNGYVGNQVVTNQIKMANGPEFATMINELDAINGVTPRYTDPNSYGTTDWYRQILGNAFTTSHQLSVTGGGDKSSYSFSLGYLKQDGIVRNNTFDRYTAKLQNDFQVFSFLKIGYALTGSVNNSHDIDNGIFHQLYSAAPIVPVYYKDGSYGDPNDFSVGNSNSFNPQVTMDYYHQKSINYRLTGNVYADLNIGKHIVFHTSAGTDFGQNELSNYLPQYVATLSQRNSTSVLTVGRGETRNWLVENTLTYDNKFGSHGIKVLLGQSAQSYKYYGFTATAQNVPNGSTGDHYLILGDPSTRFITDGGSLNTVASYFGRINYSFRDRYMLSASLRADGSSKFTGNNRWGIFPSVGAGWVISQEEFMKNQVIFNTLKLRGSWGKIGNMSVPANLSVLTVNSGYVYIGGDGSTTGGASITTIVPPTTYWELGVGTDVGLETAFLNNKLTAEFDFYNRKTEKAIFDIPILGSLGTTGSSIIGNQATFQNQGFEVLISWKNNIGTDFSYSVSGNLGINNNKVLDVSTGANPIYQAIGTTGSNNFNTRTIVGQPIGQFFGLRVLGVFQSQAEINAYTKNGNPIQPSAVPGDFKYADVNNDGVIDDKDRVVLGNPNPKFTYGFNTNWNYKSFDLMLDLQGVAGVQIYNANLGLRYGTENFSQDFYDNRWHGQGTSNTYPSANIGGGQNYRANSFYVENGSYFRVRNVQLGYTIPSSVTQKWQISKIRVYLNAQNALNLFSYRGFSPEIGGSPTRAGVDVNVYPLYATYTFGVNVTF